MNLTVGLIIAVLGLIMFLGGLFKSEFILYKALSYRYKRYSEKNYHKISLVIGILMITFGVLVIFEIIPMK